MSDLRFAFAVLAGMYTAEVIFHFRRRRPQKKNVYLPRHPEPERRRNWFGSDQH